MTPLAPHITALLRERLTEEQTRATYAYAFQLLCTFARRRLSVAPSDLQIEHLDAPLVLAFLDPLQHERGNGPRTRNARLAAVRAFMRFLEHRVPAALDQIRRVLAIPVHRTDTRVVRHLSVADSRAVLAAPDPASRLGIRDRTMLSLGFTGGLRVSELVGLRLDDVRFDGRYVEIRVRGKGRKERALLLWKEVGDALRAWLAIRGPAAVPELFLNARGRDMTRAGFAYVVRKHTATARAQCPGLRDQRISPHTLRHPCALSILQATGDIRKVSLWLGHAQQSTTEIYLQADATEKIAVLESSVPVRLRPGRFRPADRLLASLRPSKTPPPPAPG